jgi:hypothetical protein
VLAALSADDRPLHGILKGNKETRYTLRVFNQPAEPAISEVRYEHKGMLPTHKHSVGMVLSIVDRLPKEAYIGVWSSMRSSYHGRGTYTFRRPDIFENNFLQVCRCIE